MNELLPNLVSGRLSLVILPRGATRLLLELAARIAYNNPLRVLDGGNCFNAYIVARELARHTTNVERALEGIQVARAFTCYQVLTLLEETPVEEVPTLVLNLLDTFYDENVSLTERQRLLNSSLHELRRLSNRASVGISARLPGVELQEAVSLLERLEAEADHVWRLETEQPAEPLRMF